MQRLCFMLCGLLPSCLCSWASSGSFSVTQSPSTVCLKEGEEVQLTCSWNSSFAGAKVRWFKDEQRMNFNRSLTETNNNRATLMIRHVADRNHAGFYICEVTQDIPQLVRKRGAGTKVTYDTEPENATHWSTAPPEATHTSGTSVLATSVSAAAVILSICVCVSVWRLRRHCRPSGRMVIREGLPSEGEEPEHSEDGESSGTSRGSTQWYMVPVYESYFDLQRCDQQQCADSDSAAGASALKGLSTD